MSFENPTFTPSAPEEPEKDENKKENPESELGVENKEKGEGNEEKIEEETVDELELNNKEQVEENENQSVDEKDESFFDKYGAKVRKAVTLGMVGLSSFSAVKGVESAESKFSSNAENNTAQQINSSSENSQEMSDVKAKIIKALDVMSEDQLEGLADSTGMINVAVLIDKIMSYSPNTYFIDQEKKESSLRIQKQARDRRIIGSKQIYVLGHGLYVMATRDRDEYGKTDDNIIGNGHVPRTFSKDEIKDIQFIFSSK
jgi:hypothetical protein